MVGWMMVRWMHEWMKGQMVKWMVTKLDEWRNGWLDGSVDG